MMVKDISIGMQFDGFFILKTAAIKTSKNGSTYLDGTLEDRSGTVGFKHWDYGGLIGPADVGKIVKVRAEGKEYQGNLQLTVTKIRVAEHTDEYDLEELVPVAPINETEAFLQVRELIANMRDGDYRSICETMLDRYASEFRRIPAAKSFHHSFICGLLMHTSYMMRAADFYATVYGPMIDRDLLVAGTFMHDLSKREEFALSDFGIVTDYSLKGELLGHLVMGADAIGEVGAELGLPEEKILLLQHMVLSHHGKPEYGAAVIPKFAEAELLFFLDMIDSRMEIYREAYENVEPGSFSDRVFALDNKRFYRHS